MNLLSKIRKENILKTGSYITGKWNKKVYRVIRYLGSGENGQVYLVDIYGQQFALKISNESVDLSYEIRIIQRLNDTQGKSLGFSLFDIDDYQKNPFDIYTFYVMTYKKGIPLESFLYRKNEIDYSIVFYRLLQMLKIYHDEGFACGDLKPEHLLVEPLKGTISFIDYGGMTRFDEGIRQYTELYDRGSWRKGTRIADSHYDLFSIAILMIQAAIGKYKLIQIFRLNRNLKDVYDIIPNIKKLAPLEHILKEILMGKITTVPEAIQRVQPLLQRVNHRTTKKGSNWIRWLFSFSIIFLFISLYLLLEIS